MYRYKKIACLGVVVILTGCTHIPRHSFLPEEPPNEAILSVYLVSWYELGLGHIYRTPNKFMRLMDENGEVIPEEQQTEITINERDLKSVYSAIQNVIKMCEFNDVHTKASAEMTIYYSDGRTTFELTRRINVPFEDNPNEITKLISICRNCEDKYIEKAIQRMEPTQKTPVESGNEQGSKVSYYISITEASEDVAITLDNAKVNFEKYPLTLKPTDDIQDAFVSLRRATSMRLFPPYTAVDYKEFFWYSGLNLEGGDDGSFKSGVAFKKDTGEVFHWTTK